MKPEERIIRSEDAEDTGCFWKRDSSRRWWTPGRAKAPFGEDEHGTVKRPRGSSEAERTCRVHRSHLANDVVPAGLAEAERWTCLPLKDSERLERSSSCCVTRAKCTETRVPASSCATLYAFQLPRVFEEEPIVVSMCQTILWQKTSALVGFCCVPSGAGPGTGIGLWLSVDGGPWIKTFCTLLQPLLAQDRSHFQIVLTFV